MDRVDRETAERLAEWLREQLRRQASQALAEAFKAPTPAGWAALSRADRLRSAEDEHPPTSVAEAPGVKVRATSR